MSNAGVHRLLFVALVSTGQFIAGAQLRAESGPKGKSADPKVRAIVTIDQALEWLPPDTETIIAAMGPFKVPVHNAKAADNLRFEQKLESWSLVQWSFPGATEKLEGQTVALALEGARKFRSPGGLGMMRYDGCHIVVFKQDLGPAGDEWMKSLNAKAASVKELVGQRIVVLEDKLENDRWKLFVARPSPNMVLFSTDQDYLKEVLQRMNAKPKDRALPDSLPEWKHVDKQAHFWGIRHYEKANRGTDPTLAFLPVIQPVGVVFAFNPAKDKIARVKFLSANKDASKKIANPIFPEDAFKEAKQRGPGVLEFEANTEDRKAWSPLDVLTPLGHACVV